MPSLLLRKFKCFQTQIPHSLIWELITSCKITSCTNHTLYKSHIANDTLYEIDGDGMKLIEKQKIMMKLFKVALVCLILLMNVLMVQPAYADRPKLDNNIDYLEVTESLDGLLKAQDSEELPEGITSTNELQQKIAGLQYQKYIIETGEGYGICSNETSMTIAVYGAASKQSNSEYDNTLYLLPNGEATDEDWSCAGVYIPNNVKVAGINLEGASAIRILNGAQLVIKENPDTGVIELNLPPTQVLKSGDANWEIPDLAEADLNRQLPQAPTD